ncbi:hypothetical protein ABPG72_006249 [Tetrahymena utriculariae]
MRNLNILVVLSFLLKLSFQVDYICDMNQPTNVYCDQNQICQDCLNADCLYCQSDLNTCTQCVSKFLFNGQCTSTQPQGTFCDKNSKICNKCQVNSCNQCLDDIQTCQKCDQSTTKKYLYKNSCLDFIPDYVECDSSSNICTNKPPTYCTPNCLTCDYEQKICLQCSNNYFKVISQPPSIPICQKECPSNSSQLNSECYVCPQFCVTCDSQFKCLSCQAGYSLQDSVCSPCKELGQGLNPTTLICENCQIQKCLSCISDSSKCNICTSGYYFVENTCQLNHPIGYYCDSQNVCFKCNAGCKTCNEYNSCNNCSDNCLQCLDQNTCTACSDEFQLQNQKCICKKGNYDSIKKICQTCQDITSKEECNQQNINNCFFFQEENKCVDMQNSTFYCDKDNKCQQQQPNNTYCIEKQNSINKLNQYNCFQCDQSCSGCTEKTNKDCSNCSEGYTLSNNSCQQQFKIYNSESFTEEKVKQMSQQVSASSQATTISTVVLNSISNVFYSSSFSIVMSGLSCQKLSYLIIVDCNIPSPVFQPLNAQKDQIPTQSFKFLNFLNYFIPKDSIYYYDVKFENINLSYNILFNSGSAISVFLICIFLLALFYILTEKVSNEKVQSISKTVYNNAFSGLMVSYLQLSMSIFVIGINVQIKEFINNSNIKGLGFKIPFIIILIILVTEIFRWQFKYLNLQKSLQVGLNFYEITREKILNDTIYEIRIARNFILINLFFESLLTPTLFIQFSFSWQMVTVAYIILQLLLLTITIYAKPFKSKLTNLYFMANSILWIGLMIQYYIINFYMSKSDYNSYVKILDNCCLLFLINVQMILLINPVYMVLAILVKIYKLIQQKRQQKRHQQQFDSLPNQNCFLKLNSLNSQNQPKAQSLFDLEISFQNQFSQITKNNYWIRKKKLY